MTFLPAVIMIISFLRAEKDKSAISRLRLGFMETYVVATRNNTIIEGGTIFDAYSYRADKKKYCNVKLVLETSVFLIPKYRGLSVV